MLAGDMYKLDVLFNDGTALDLNQLKVMNNQDYTQSISFLLVIERLERARCTTARETGVEWARLCLSLAPVSQLP